MHKNEHEKSCENKEKKLKIKLEQEVVVTFDEAPTDENLASAHIAFVESEMIGRPVKIEGRVITAKYALHDPDLLSFTICFYYFRPSIISVFYYYASSCHFRPSIVCVFCEAPTDENLASAHIAFVE